MDKTQIEKLHALIGEVVSGDGTWQEKRDAILEGASESELTNLTEFVGWFEVIDDEGKAA